MVEHIIISTKIVEDVVKALEKIEQRLEDLYRILDSDEGLSVHLIK